MLRTPISEIGHWCHSAILEGFLLILQPWVLRMRKAPCVGDAEQPQGEILCVEGARHGAVFSLQPLLLAEQT